MYPSYSKKVIGAYALKSLWFAGISTVTVDGEGSETVRVAVSLPVSNVLSMVSVILSVSEVFPWVLDALSHGLSQETVYSISSRLPQAMSKVILSISGRRKSWKVSVFCLRLSAA